MKIDIQKIQIKNFFSFGNKWQEIKILPGLNLVTGKNINNNSNNGVGKSVFIDSIIFGLFGETTKNINKPQIINWKNGKNCEVKIYFSKDTDNYVIHRGLKPNFLNVLKNNIEEPQLSRNLDFQQEIEKRILEIDYETFISLIFYNTAISSSIFNVPKNQKRTFIEKLFGLEIYSNLLKKSQEKSSSIEEKLLILNQKENSNNISLKEINKQNQDFINKIEDLNFQLNLNEISDIEYNLKTLNEEKKILNKRETENINKTIKINENISSINNIINKINYKKIFFENNIKNLNTLKFIDVSNIQQKIENIKNELGSLNNINDKDIQYEDLQNNLLILKEKKINAELQLKNLPIFDSNNDNCPICNSKINSTEINKNFENKILELKEQITFWNNSILKEEKFINQIKIQIENNKKQHEKILKLTSNLKDYEFELININKNNNDFNNNKQFLQKSNKFIKIYNNILNKQNNSLYKQNKLLSIVVNQKNELINIENDIQNLNFKLEKLQEINIEKNNQIKDLENFIKQNKQKINIILNDNENLQNDKNKYKNINDYLDYIKKICKDENIKQYAISNTINFLNQKINKYLSEVGCLFYIKLDSWLNIEIKGPGINNASFGNLSSGQQKITNLATILAFLDLFKLRSPNQWNILLLDEVLDSAIDSTTITQMMNIIENKQKEENLKVFLVSHRKEIDQICNFNNSYYIQMENGFSKLQIYQN